MTAGFSANEGAMQRTRLILAAMLALSGCDIADTTDMAMRRAAETVVTPVIDDNLTGDQAALATDCIVGAATAEDLRLLVRDVAVVAGTSTVANVLDIASRPEVEACLAAAGVPLPLEGPL